MTLDEFLDLAQRTPRNPILTRPEVRREVTAFLTECTPDRIEALLVVAKAAVGHAKLHPEQCSMALRAGLRKLQQTVEGVALPFGNDQEAKR